jgi:competence protein ComEC
VAGVVAALVTGDQRAIDRADWDVFRATGVAHLMSISGLHITLFAWLAAALVRLLWRRSPRLCLACPRPRRPWWQACCWRRLRAVQRLGRARAAHGAMLAVVAAAAAQSGAAGPGRRCGCWPALVVLADPWALWQAGFWLSFVAVAVLFATDLYSCWRLSQKR